MRLALLAALALVGCRLAGPASGAPPPEVFTVFAASSLTEVMAELERAYEQAHPQVDVITSFAGSQTLRLQLEQGAPADVYLSADPLQVQALSVTGRVSQVSELARNQLALVVPEDNPAGITGLSDLGRADRLVIGTPASPIGRYTRALLRRAEDQLGAGLQQDVLDSVVSEEANARLTRAKVLLGEADAAVIYVSDTRVPGLRVVPIPQALQVPTTYQAAGVTETRQPERVTDFLAFLGSPAAQDRLAAAGLEPVSR